MRRVALFGLALAMGASVHAQNWKPCEAITSQWKATIEKFNAEYKGDGLILNAECLYSNPEPRKPEIHYPLRKSEVAILNDLRAASDAAFTAQSNYENHLLMIHGHPQPDYGDPCWHYVGIKMKDDFITVDENYWNPGCREIVQ